MIIAFPNKAAKQGGPSSFQRKFEKYLKSEGWEVVYPEDEKKPDFVMVLGGTKKIFWLLKMKIRGVKIYFRLGGINWLYKFKKLTFKRKLYIDSQILLIPYVQKFFANGIIYQSEFSREWLLKLKQSAKIENTAIIYNGVDLEEFKPSTRSNEGVNLLCIEGNIDYSPFAIELLNTLVDKLINSGYYKSIVLYGNFENHLNKDKLKPEIQYKGYINHYEISKIYKDAVYLSLDVNAACPNTVIEALASGIPVIGFDTGALRELVPEEAGEIVDYGGNPWKLDFPNMDNLAEAAKKVLNNYEYYSNNARKVAEERYSIEMMVKKYVNIIDCLK